MYLYSQDIQLLSTLLLKSLTSLKAFLVYIYSSLGFVDMLSMIGRLLISLYFILIPAKRLKLTYFICALLQTLGLSLVASLHIFPHFSKPFYMIGMTLFGLGRVPAFLYLILVDHFDEE